VIVSPQPAGCKIPNLIELVEQVMSQAIVAHCAVIAFDVGVLLRLSRLNEVKADAALSGLRQVRGADVLRTAIATNDHWLTSPFDDPVELSDDPFRGQLEVELDTESFAVVVVDYIEQTDIAAIGQLVMHEVHRPAWLICADTASGSQRGTSTLKVIYDRFLGVFSWQKLLLFRYVSSARN
jgi:hypothetical protein